ncbi:MAG: PHP domain-containing protein [Clostridia bacterium]|nr:PHP domain-containing protein [Clostridia bacterium]
MRPRCWEKGRLNVKEQLINKLFCADCSTEERLSALRELGDPCPQGGNWVNNHIHTTYSFSPYTPAAAVYFARNAGLSTAGIMDHDSVGGIDEFLEAGRIIGMPVTVGFECRTSVKGTPLEGLRLNNPDQVSVAYVTLHGIPHQNIPECERALAPLREKRNVRNRKMCDRINELCKGLDIFLDFDSDVLPLSRASEGGSVTERHVLFGLTLKIAEGKERADAVALVDKLCGGISEKIREKLLSAPDEYYLYDVLGVLKSSLVSKIYIDADDELMHISEFTALAKRVGGIAAYAYLGDVGESPTGDKAAQKFEDSYLDLLFETLGGLGFDAVTYMPSRNTKQQLDRVMELCERHGFFQISGEDINSPRQSFVCPAMEPYTHLYSATWALIGHEKAASENAEKGMFTRSTVERIPNLKDRISYFSEIGRNI